MIRVALYASYSTDHQRAASIDDQLRICRDFAVGVGSREIARTLNNEGIPGPNGKPWIDTTIRGHAQRGTGIVNNELYIGRLV